MDEVISERSRKNAGFRRLVDSALDRRRLLQILADRRAKLGLTQIAVAKRMHTSQSAVARIEAGEIDAKLSTVERYASAIGQRVEWSVVSRSSNSSRHRRRAMAGRRAVKGGYRGGDGGVPKRPSAAGASVNPKPNSSKTTTLRKAARHPNAKSA